jgi:ribosomal protein S18 acetylase RimI-like enzyme
MMIIAEGDNVVLRQARDDDLPRVDEIAIMCYKPIFDSYVAMLGQECYEAVRHDPELTWEERKTGQVRRLYGEHPEWLWVLEEEGKLIGFVTFELIPEKNMGAIENNGVHPDHAGQGWGKLMYRHVLQHFREQGLRFAFVDTGLDDAHIPARRAYEAVGFDRPVPMVHYWQDLDRHNLGSEPE